MKRLQNPQRVFRLVDEAIARLGLDLSGLRVLTEAASGAFVVTPLIAARAGADRVFAVTRDSPYGSAAAVLDYAGDAAAAFGVGDRIEWSTAAPEAFAAQADIVTNLGFVRPIDAPLVARMRQHAVVSLMCEPWEVRADDVDIAACWHHEVAVIGTCETDPRLDTFAYVGVVALRLIIEAGVEVLRSRVLVLGSDPFGAAVQATLVAAGASVTRVTVAPERHVLDDVLGAFVEQSDAVVLAEHRDRRQLIGAAGIRPDRFVRSGCALVHIAGNVDDAAIVAAGVTKHPSRRVAPGCMTVTTDYAGPRPVVDLHTAGLYVGALVAKQRRNGVPLADAMLAAQQSGLGLIPLVPDPTIT